MIERWADAPDDASAQGRSARYLRDTGQQQDLDFVLEPIDDLDSTFMARRRGATRLGAVSRR